MHDLKTLRNDPDKLIDQLRRRGQDDGAAIVGSVLRLDQRRRELLAEVEELKRRRNEASQQVAMLKQKGEDASALIEETKSVNARIPQLDAEHREVEQQLDQELLCIPNSFAADVPVGAGEDDNVEIARWGEPRQFDFAPRPHWEIGEMLGIIDSERGAKISGSRFYVLRGAGAALERALITFMLDVHIRQHGYTEIFPPFMVRSECMLGTGQLPKFGEDAYHVESDDLWLVPTAEVPVTNLHREEILDEAALPIKYVAYSACFRREAGAAGRDTRGIIRVHQYNKVELVKFTRPDDSYAELEALRRDAELILELLELPYRTMEHCTADLTFSSAKSYDPEVWLPAQNCYREISSCSNFEAFQARRANIRYRPVGAGGKAGKPEYVHTLNGSGLAIGRTMAAVLENYQNEDGTVRVPEILRPYLHGLEAISC